MDKKRLKAAFVEVEKAIIKDLRSEIEAIHGAVDLDEESTLDPEDYSHQTESGVIEHSQSQRLVKAEAQLDLLDSLSVEPKTNVGPGAIVRTKNYTFYISIASRPFTYDKQLITPLSVHAPVYLSMSDKKAGESVAIGEASEKILTVE